MNRPQTASVYHFTDTMRLPWILAERQLSPTRGMCSADYPRPTFLWATTNAVGDATAACGGKNNRTLWRQGRIQLVRFILAAADFTPWTVMREQAPQWTQDKIARDWSATAATRAAPRSSGCAGGNAAGGALARHRDAAVQRTVAAV